MSKRQTRKLFSDSNIVNDQLDLGVTPRKTKRKEPTKETKETEFHLDELFDDYYKGHRTGGDGKENNKKTVSFSSVSLKPKKSSSQNNPAAPRTVLRPILASTPHARKNSSTSTSDGTVDSLTENEDSIGSSSGTSSHNKHTIVSSGAIAKPPGDVGSDKVEHGSCAARINELSLKVQRVADSTEKPKKLAREDYGIGRCVYSVIHETFDSSEKLTSDHNNKVVLLLIAALTSRGYSTDNSLILAKMNYRRVKEQERPRSANEQRRMTINKMKTKKLKRRKSKQLPEEAAQYPLMYEFMSSEDEETVSKVGFLTEQAERHIKELDDRCSIIRLKEENDSTRKPSVKASLNPCVKKEQCQRDSDSSLRQLLTK